METFADYILKEPDLINKMDILNRLQRLLKERRGITIFFNNTIIFKTEIARMFMEYSNIDIDENLVLTACLLCNCKKIDGPQSLESLHSYAKNGADFLSTLGFDKRFCKICEEVNRYSGSEPREPESDILELVDNFGGMLLDRPERAGFTPKKAIIQLEEEKYKKYENKYFEQFKEFVELMQEVEIQEKVGTVKMKPLYAIKRACEEYSMEKIIGGGILRRFQMITNRAVKEKIEEKQENVDKKSYQKDNAMFGIEVLEELGINIQKTENDVEKNTQISELTEDQILR